jgi:hypothetical protein
VSLHPPGPYIDFHVHLFPERLRLAIRNWFLKVGWQLWFDRPWEEAAAFLEGLEPLERYVCFGYAHRPGIARELNAFYAAVGRASPKAVALGCLHQDDLDPGRLAEEALDAGLAGFKLHCQVQQVAPDDARLFPLYEVVRDRGAFVLLHAGTGPFAGPHVGYGRFEGVLRRFPGLKCVVAHLGCFEPELFLQAALEHEGLYLDTSYTFLANPTNRMDAPLELVERAAEKVLFATDFPGICHSYKAAVQAVAELPLSPRARQLIFRENAARLLGLGEA